MSDKSLADEMRAKAGVSISVPGVYVNPELIHQWADEVKALAKEHHELCATPYAERVRENVAMKENAAGLEARIDALEHTIDLGADVIAIRNRRIEELEATQKRYISVVLAVILLAGIAVVGWYVGYFLHLLN